MFKVCSTCNRPIKSNQEVTQIVNDTYHKDCIICMKCGTSLRDKSFIKKTDGRLLCEEPCQTNTTRFPLTADWQTTSTLFKQPILNSNESFTNGAILNSNSENHFSFQHQLPPLVPQLNHKDHNSGFHLKKFNQDSKMRPESLETHRSTDCLTNDHQISDEFCKICRKLVKDKEKFIFEDKIYHQNCLACDECQCKLYYMRKIFKNSNNTFDENNYCEPCFYKIFGEKCWKCMQPVPPYCFSVRHEDKIYHKECFLCVRCKKSLANKQVHKVGNLLICKSCF